jgi:hypothetical protein
VMQASSSTKTEHGGDTKVGPCLSYPLDFGDGGSII